MSYGYGAFINFTHQTVRLKSGYGLYVTTRDRMRYDVPFTFAKFEDGWPGEPVDPDGWDPGRPLHKDERLLLLEPPLSNLGAEKLGGPVARLRRLLFAAAGLVIGSTLKSEGTIDSGPSHPDEGPIGWLNRQRTVRLLEVAVAPEHHGKARVVLVWPGDVISGGRK